MNLIGDPWIPVVDRDGNRVLVGLEQVFGRGDNLRDLVVTPPERIALMRLLVCIAQAALDGPRDEDEWRTCRERMGPAARAYLAQRRGLFELWGERAFLQVPGLVGKCDIPFDKLDFALASGNNTTLFDHAASAGGRPHEDARLALMLLTYQCFSPGGRIGVAAWAGRPTGNGSSSDAPCSDGSPLHAWVRCSDLIDTIHTNLLTREQVRGLPGGLWGTPVWEAFPASASEPEAERWTHSYLGRLVPLARALKLDRDSQRCILADGLVYAKFPAVREPSCSVVLRGKKEALEPRYLRVSIVRHPWRDLHSVFALERAGAGGPLALQHLLSAGDDGTVDVWTGGLARDKAKVIDWAEWVFSVPRRFVGELPLRVYQSGMELAERAERALGKAVGEYCDRVKLEAKNTLLPAARLAFWSDLEASRRVLVDAACGDTGDLGAWTHTAWQTARSVFGRTCAHVTPRQIQAFAAALHVLTWQRETMARTEDKADANDE